MVIEGIEEIEVSGVVPIFEEDLRAAPDPLRAYRQAISRYSGSKRQGKNSPHVQFANADSVQKQVAFLKQYGPVVVSSFRTEERPIRPQGSFDFGLTEAVRIARQNVSELGKEQLVYRSMLALVSELQRGKEADVIPVRDCISKIVGNVFDWPRQWERERKLRASGLGLGEDPDWNFGPRHFEKLKYWMWNAEREASSHPLDALSRIVPIHCGHLVVCELVNAFPPIVYPWRNSPVEAPECDIAAGVRPLLYYMLRKEYLGGSGVGICRNSDCRAIFEIERTGQEFCAEDCSRLQRQREYWKLRGKKLRKSRKRESRRTTNGSKRQEERQQ